MLAWIGGTIAMKWQNYQALHIGNGEDWYCCGALQGTACLGGSCKEPTIASKLGQECVDYCEFVSSNSTNGHVCTGWGQHCYLDKESVYEYCEGL